MSEWQPIETAPRDTPVILANFSAKCLLTGSPHVWTAMYVTKWENANGDEVEENAMWCEASYAAMNKNGQPTHWMPLPPSPMDKENK